MTSWDKLWIEPNPPCSTSGNYYIDITPDFNLNVSTEAILVSESNLPYDKKFYMAIFNLDIHLLKMCKR